MPSTPVTNIIVLVYVYVIFDMYVPRKENHQLNVYNWCWKPSKNRSDSMQQTWSFQNPTTPIMQHHLVRLCLVNILLLLQAWPKAPPKPQMMMWNTYFSFIQMQNCDFVGFCQLLVLLSVPLFNHRHGAHPLHLWVLTRVFMLHEFGFTAFTRRLLNSGHPLSFLHNNTKSQKKQKLLDIGGNFSKT